MNTFLALWLMVLFACLAVCFVLYVVERGLYWLMDKYPGYERIVQVGFIIGVITTIIAIAIWEMKP